MLIALHENVLMYLSIIACCHTTNLTNKRWELVFFSFLFFSCCCWEPISLERKFPALMTCLILLLFISKRVLSCDETRDTNSNTLLVFKPSSSLFWLNERGIFIFLKFYDFASYCRTTVLANNNRNADTRYTNLRPVFLWASRPKQESLAWVKD